MSQENNQKLQEVFTPELIEYYKTNKNLITSDLLAKLREFGDDGKQLALDILETEKSEDNYYLDAFGKKISFEGDRNLKPAFTQMKLSPIHIEEIEKCSKDLNYFMDNYIKIRTKKGYNFPELRGYQKRFIDILNSDSETVVGLLGRQSGKSVTVGIFMCWHFNFNSALNIGICANKKSLAMEFLNNIKEMFYSMPMWMKQGILGWSKTTIESELKMRVLTDAPGDNAFRGYSLSLLVIDESAWMASEKFQALLDSVLPAQGAMSWKKNVFISTPNGMNHFYDLVEGSRKRKIIYGLNKEQIEKLKETETILKETESSPGIFDVTIDKPSNNMALFEMDWREVPRFDSKGNRIDPEKFKEDIIAKYGATYFAQNFSCSFLGSSHTLVSKESLQRFKSQEPEMILAQRLKVYKEPEPKHKYIIGVDPAKFGGDSYAIQVLDVTSFPFVQVASAKLKDENFQIMPGYIVEWGKWYNEGLLIIENNEGAGTYANVVIHNDYEYENLYFERTFGTFKHDTKTKIEPGFRTTPKSRNIIIDTLKQLIDNELLIINDSDTIKEFNTFVLKKDKYQADDGCHDDMIMSLCIALAPFGDVKNFDNITDLVKKMYSKDTTTDFTDYLCLGNFDDYSDFSVDDSGSFGSDFDDVLFEISKKGSY